MTGKSDPNVSVSWKDWIERAGEDYLLAISAVRRKTPLTYGATFHAQQCIEKYLKALLISRQVSFPRTHDLAALGYLCEQAGIILPIDDDALELLTAYAVETRYPGTLPTIEEAKEAIKLAQIMRRFIKRRLSL
ncbi:MAG: HEPN domain-containing protein [Anaerolineaceae bacterium]|nr:HEPN domain-containing protein [Anaerolineaceae bacterium]